MITFCCKFDRIQLEVVELRRGGLGLLWALFKTPFSWPQRLACIIHEKQVQCPRTNSGSSSSISCSKSSTGTSEFLFMPPVPLIGPGTSVPPTPDPGPSGLPKPLSLLVAAALPVSPLSSTPTGAGTLSCPPTRVGINPWPPAGAGPSSVSSDLSVSSDQSPSTSRTCFCLTLEDSCCCSKATRFLLHSALRRIPGASMPDWHAGHFGVFGKTENFFWTMRGGLFGKLPGGGIGMSLARTSVGRAIFNSPGFLPDPEEGALLFKFLPASGSGCFKSRMTSDGAPSGYSTQKTGLV